MSWLNEINWDQMITAINETILMSLIALVFAIVIGLFI